MSASHTHSVHFTNANIDFDFVTIKLMVQLSENIILYNQLNQTGFILNTDFDSISQMDRSVDAFNQLFYINVKLTFRDLTQIRNLNELGYFTQYDKWNYSGSTQNALIFSDSIVDASYQIMPDTPNQQLKFDFMLYMVETYLGSARLGPIIKKKQNMINDVVVLDSTINTQILNDMLPLTNDGVLFEEDYQLELSNNYFPLNNEDGTKTSTHNPFRILASSILNENIIDSSNHVLRRGVFKNYINTIMDHYYTENEANIFYVTYQTDTYDASNVYVQKYAGPLFFDLSQAIINNDLFQNPTLDPSDVLVKTYEKDYVDYAFYALPEDVSGGYRTYEISNNVFADVSSDIYTLIANQTSTTIVDLESFNSKLIPFKFMNGDVINVIIEYSPTQTDISGANVQQKVIPPRKYKVKINLKNFYYDYIEATNTYTIFYNKEKVEDGTLSNANVLHSAFQASGDPSLNTHGWNYTLNYDINEEPERQTEIITSLYNSNIPHIEQAFNIQLLDQNTSNNYNKGASDLKFGHLITDYFVDTSNTGFQWQTADTSNSIPIVQDPNNNAYYISSSSTRFIQNDNSIGINTQSDPIFVFQILVNKPIKSADFFVFHVDSFTNNKQKNASGILGFDYRMVFKVKMEEFTQSFYVAFLDQTFEVSQINGDTNLFLVYPPDKLSAFETDVSNNASTYDVTGYSTVCAGLYLTTVTKNDDSSQLLNSSAIDWNTNADVSKMTLHLTSHTGESGTFDPSDFTLRNIKINVNSTSFDYQYYTTE